MVLHRGAAHPTRRLACLPAIGEVPEGALAIPRYKVCTIIGAMQDVELHELHGVFHAGRSTQVLPLPFQPSPGPCPCPCPYPYPYPCPYLYPYPYPYPSYRPRSRRAAALRRPRPP